MYSKIRGWGLIWTLGVYDKSNPNSFSGAEGMESSYLQVYEGGAEEGCDF